MDIVSIKDNNPTIKNWNKPVIRDLAALQGTFAVSTEKTSYHMPIKCKHHSLICFKQCHI